MQLKPVRAMKQIQSGTIITSNGMMQLKPVRALKHNLWLCCKAYSRCNSSPWGHWNAFMCEQPAIFFDATQAREGIETTKAYNFLDEVCRCNSSPWGHWNVYSGYSVGEGVSRMQLKPVRALKQERGIMPLMFNQMQLKPVRALKQIRVSGT